MQHQKCHTVTAPHLKNIDEDNARLHVTAERGIYLDPNIYGMQKPIGGPVFGSFRQAKNNISHCKILSTKNKEGKRL